MRTNSIAFCGGAFGDEGKGRIVDWYVDTYAKRGPVVVYRDNGGANAGHTVEVGSTRVALHQLPSGILVDNVSLVLGKGMVIHPQDLLSEIEEVEKLVEGKITKKIKLDHLATLSLDTHRAFEAALKQWQSGSKGSTGRGISPAYADILLRHPVQVRDMVPFNKEKITEHYKLYEALVKGLGETLAEMKVPSLAGGQELSPVGSLDEFIQKLQAVAKKLEPMVTDVVPFLSESWNDDDYFFVFEKAQAVGLDNRWGVYPDITASDTTVDGIFAASEGVIDPDEIPIRGAVLKATYMSSVGSRVLPTAMPEKEAHRIREDADEYGATTKRPRDIAYFDIPAQRYFAKVGRVTHLVLTHMDIVYADTKVKVCTKYLLDGKEVDYRPDQEFLNKVEPVYEEVAPWDAEKIAAAKTRKELPKEASAYIMFLEEQIGLPVLLMTTGPERQQTVFLREE